ncbi:hypothetical protein B1T45_07745 [Mycobacterium kansasii]|nr:hypothetical protein B1T45_07745 [Mycobacterium kansasii]ARG68914.1 hypothetical protein B1T47_07515 [Mycobacterium kansasii]ORC12844.1 hypothetical protein B1T46_20870 [Mycobacterium kansasii]POX93656.1 hypothetical protein C3473_16390 [Mycobacterium kansasii]
MAELVGLTDEQRAGGLADLDVVQRWLDDGIAPNGARGRRFAAGDNHGVDLTFCAPKSLSLVRAYGADVMQKAVLDAHNTGVREALEYVHQHAGYTRVHNTTSGKKDLQRLPGLVAVASHHETSRAGDPHLHTHVILPNKQARVDGTLAAVDTDSLWHESKAGGVIYQATMRREMAQSVGAEWGPVDPHTGMAELVGVDPAVIKAHSQRSTQLREWADCNLELIDGQPTPAQLAAAQKATRPRKPEGLSWGELRRQWHGDPRGFRVDTEAQRQARSKRRAAPTTFGAVSPRSPPASTSPRSPAPTWWKSSARNYRSRSTEMSAPLANRSKQRSTRSRSESANRAPPITAKATSATPSTWCSPRSASSSTWSIFAMTAPLCGLPRRTRTGYQPINNKRSPPWPNPRGWYSLWPRPPAPARPIPSKRYAPPPTAAAAPWSCSRPKAALSTWRSTSAPATRATPWTRPSSSYATGG